MLYSMTYSILIILVSYCPCLFQKKELQEVLRALRTLKDKLVSINHENLEEEIGEYNICILFAVKRMLFYFPVHSLLGTVHL